MGQTSHRRSTHRNTEGCVTLRSRSVRRSSHHIPEAMLTAGLCPAAVTIETCDSHCAGKVTTAMLLKAGQSAAWGWVTVWNCVCVITVLTEQEQLLLCLLSLFCLTLLLPTTSSCTFLPLFMSGHHSQHRWAWVCALYESTRARVCVGCASAWRQWLIKPLLNAHLYIHKEETN